MENEVKQRTQRNRRRERAQRMQAQKRENKVKNGGAADSGEDESPTREKPQRPPPPSRRKKSKEPAFEEDVIDGFAILSFKTYEDLENTIRLCSKAGACSVTLGWEDVVPKTEPVNNHVHTRQHPNNNNNNTTTNNHHDKGPSPPEPTLASDDNTREPPRPAPPRPRAPSHDRLSDTSSRCSSGRGYICDSEGDDDKDNQKNVERPLFFPNHAVGAKPIHKESRWKGSDGGSVLFTPSVRKHELPGLPPSLHPPVGVGLLNGGGTPGARSPARGSPSPPPAKPVGLAPPLGPAPAASPRPQSPPPPTSQPLPPPAAAPTIAHYPIPNGSVASHPTHNHSKLPTSSPSHSPRSAPAVVVSSAYPLPPASYAPPHLPPPGVYSSASTPSNSSPMVVATPSSYVPPPLSLASPYTPLYAPYNSTPYLPPMSHASRMNRSPVSSVKPPVVVTSSVAPVSGPLVTTTTTSHRDIVTTPLVGRSHSPRGHSPTRERDSYSSNVSSLSRGSVTPVNCAVPPANPSPFSAPAPGPGPGPAHSQPSSLAYPATKPPVWVGVSSSSSLPGAPSVPRHHPHPFPPPMFAPPAPTAAPNPAAPPTNPNPFSAESLFQSSMSIQHPDLYKDQADLLRRELDTRFLASQDRPLVPPPYLRTEMHHHQHQHTHVHQHTTPMLPPPPSTLFAPPIFKEIPKLGGVDSPFYRQGLGLSSYPGFSPGLLHPSIGAATPFAPPNHLPTFTPKQLTDNTKPKPVNLRTSFPHHSHKMSINFASKTGKWNAMHVRIAWEIYHHQQKQAAEVKAGVGVGGGVPTKSELLRPPTHLFPPRPHDMPPFAAPHRPPHPFESSTHPSATPYAGIGSSMFGRYPPTPTVPSLATFPPSPLYDPWSRLQPRTSSLAPTALGASVGPWSLKPDPGMTEVDREREREREREKEKERERSRERERQRREDKHRRLLAAQQQQQQQQQQQNKVRDRSPLRDPAGIVGAPQVVPKEEEVLLLGRPPPHYLPRPPPRSLPHPSHFPPSPWDHHPFRSYDHLRYNPLMAAALREEEERAKLFAGFPPPPHLRAKAPSPHRPPPSHHSLAPHPHSHPHTDHKKEESSQSR